RPGTRLVDVDRELVVVGPVRHRGGGGRDRARDIGIDQAERGIRLRGGELEEGECPDEPPREALARDREVEDGPLGRRPVERIGGHRHLPHRIAFDASGLRLIGHAPIVASAARRGPTTYRRWVACRSNPTEPYRASGAASAWSGSTRTRYPPPRNSRRTASVTTARASPRRWWSGCVPTGSSSPTRPPRAEHHTPQTARE